jgi:hypothetical protein
MSWTADEVEDGRALIIFHVWSILGGFISTYLNHNPEPPAIFSLGLATESLHGESQAVRVQSVLTNGGLSDFITQK